MAEARLCPLYCTDCAGERLRMEQHPQFRDWACSQCGICGPAETLDRVTPRSRKLTAEELAQLTAPRPLEPWDELEAAAEELDPGHLLRVNQELRATVEGLRRVTRAAIQEREQLAERVITIADEAAGLHPEQTADEALTRVERELFEWRARVSALEAELARLKQPDGYSDEYIEASLRRYAKKLERTRHVASRHLFTAAELLHFTSPDPTGGDHG